LFEKKVPARKFSTTSVDVFGEEVARSKIENYREQIGAERGVA
jgi:hypothetical protein